MLRRRGIDDARLFTGVEFALLCTVLGIDGADRFLVRAQPGVRTACALYLLISCCRTSTLAVTSLSFASLSLFAECVTCR